MTKLGIKLNYYGIGIERPKFQLNVGGLWRAAFVYGADFIFTVTDIALVLLSSRNSACTVSIAGLNL